MRLKQQLLTESTWVTERQETLFAVGYAIYQMKNRLTVDMLLDGDLFESAYRTFVVSNVPSNEVFIFAQNQSTWCDSVVSSVNSYMKSPYKPKGKYKIYRGAGVMLRVYEQAQRLIVSGGDTLNSDKWNPGDVWIASMRDIKEHDTILELNTYIRDGIEKRDLLPISLKKTNKAKVSYENQGFIPPQPNYRGIKQPTTPFNTGIEILTSDPSIVINLRSFSRSSTASVQNEIISPGNLARYGKKTPVPLIKKYGIPQTKISNFRNNSEDEGMMVDRILTLWADLKYRWSQSQIDGLWSERVNDKDDQYQNNKAGYWRSIINALEIGVFLDKNDEAADDYVKTIIKLAASKSKISSDFILIK